MSPARTTPLGLSCYTRAQIRRSACESQASLSAFNSLSILLSIPSSLPHSILYFLFNFLSLHCFFPTPLSSIFFQDVQLQSRSPNNNIHATSDLHNSRHRLFYLQLWLGSTNMLQRWSRRLHCLLAWYFIRCTCTDPTSPGLGLLFSWLVVPAGICICLWGCRDGCWDVDPSVASANWGNCCWVLS